MKKLYSLALAAIVGSATAFAATPVLKADLNKAELSKAEINKSELTVAPTRTAIAATSLHKAPSRPAKAPEYEDMTWSYLGEGKYASSVVADTYGGSNDPVVVDIYESNENEGVYKVVGVWPDIIRGGGELIVDASNPEYVMVPVQDTGVIDDVDGETYIASQTYLFVEDDGYAPEVVISNVPEIVPVLEDGVIVFPVKSLVLNWPNAPLDSKFGTEADKWYIGENQGLLVLPGAEYVDPWTFLGTGVFTDNSLAGTFGLTVDPYEVEVYQGTVDTNLYLVKNPWKGFYASQGWSSVSPEIELDATDPDNVLLPLTSTGINGGSDGLYYIFNDGWNCDESGDTPEGYTTLTNENNTLTFTFNPASLYLYASSSKKIYYCGRVATSTIVIPVDSAGTSSVDEVVVEANAPVEYFNLQGVRIDNPAAGQVVIKRQGTAVSKVFVR